MNFTLAGTAAMPPKFHLGQLVATPAALKTLERAGQHASTFLRKHAAGDWGEISGADQRANARSLREGGPLVSLYRTSKGDGILVITDYDRSVTTILLADEY